MTFDELESRYAELRRQHSAGQLSDQAFSEAVDQLQIQDEQGRVWAIGAQSGSWYVYQDCTCR